MSNFYDDKVTWEGCSALDNAINIEINGTQFDLWYNKACQIVNPTSNNALSSGELEKKKQETATEYGISPNVLDWENERYVSIMEEQEERVLSAIQYLFMYYDIPKENVTGHFNVDSGTGKPDPGPRFLECIKKKL
ncbi:hypothetical protein A2446_02645 [Candidatus Roizmanbacteria bacterium RIFOXYC2_FULL_38_9]|nr:MAG: hypothetical protein A2446_02645 [Candidatus Roizmanbacteria bacterium RIFOXYC2_FULL_38_9]